MSMERNTPTTAGVGPAPAGGIAGSAPAAVSPAAAAGQGRGLVKRVRAAAVRIVAAERKRPGTYPDWLVELAARILLTPVPQLATELRELAERGRLSALDPLFEVGEE